MADKSTFTPDEWKRILGSTMLASMAVTMADHGGLWGMLKEGLASGSALADAQRDPNANGLVRAVVADFMTSEGRAAARDDIKATLDGATSAADAQAKAVNALKDVAALLDTKAPADAPAFKAWLESIGNRTANAANEGGFLGFGGVAVSDAEKTALEQIANALRPAAAA
ncbi:MAG: hypothetical protein GEU95_05735 [Rhizobiales bacterium]|nr:hypothetical protein [Hyphomicrobiales bacterium]